MKKIILITCYFGKFPWYFNLFLKSAGHNHSIDIIIFSDCEWNYEIPKNVTIIPFSMSQFNQLATMKLGFDINVKSAYKMCDFKTTYGLIFSEYTESYDFWGTIDIDVVYGRIREFMTDELLSQKEVIFVRDDYPTGCFMLFKNIDRINTLFTKSKDYKRVLTSEVHYCFDECNFKHYYLQGGGDIFDIECDIESMHHVVKKEEKESNLKSHFDLIIIEGQPGQLKWKNGILTFKNEFEIFLHHLILYKDNVYTRKVFWRNVPSTFYIDKYLIRKNSSNSINGALMSFIFNKTMPFFKISFFKFDFFVSKIFNISSSKLSSRNYTLNGRNLVISKDANNRDLMLINGKTKNIIKSVFTKNSFFLDSVKSKRYQIIKENSTLVEFFIQGNYQKYV